MSEQHYEPRTVVLVMAEGEHEGRLAYIAEWVPPTGKYLVQVDTEGTIESFEPKDLAVLVPANLRHEELDDEEEAEVDPEAFDPIPPFGMTRDETADYVGDFIDVVMARVINEPHDPNRTFQEFETRDFKQLLTNALTEIEAVAVDAATIHLRVRRVLAAIGDSL